jgi:serine/threonine-protein kinase
VGRRRPGVVALVAALALAAGGVAAYQVLAPRPRPPRIEIAPREPARPPTMPPPLREEVPAEVTFTVQSEPPGAEVTVAGRSVGQTPLAMHLPRRDGEVELVIRAAGYKETRRTLRADRDRDLELTLAAEPRPSKPTRRAGKARGSDDQPFAPVGD